MKRLLLLFLPVFFSSVLIAQTTPGPREGHSLVYSDGSLYLFGGITTESAQESSLVLKSASSSGVPKNDLFQYGQGGTSWQRVSATDTPEARTDQTANILPDGRIAVLFGNPGDGGDYLRDGYIFDPATNHWEQITFSGPVPNNRAMHCAAVIGDKLYIFGGITKYTSDGISYSGYSNDLFFLDLTTFTWNYIAVMGSDVPPPTYGASMVAYNGKLYIFTGKTQAGGETSYSKKVYEFNPGTGQYTELNSLPGDGRYKVQATVNEEKGEISVWGGGNDSERFIECWLYNVGNNDWSQGTIPDEVDLYASKAATDGQGTTWFYGGVTETSVVQDDFYKVKNQGEETEEWYKYRWEKFEWGKIGGEKPVLTLSQAAVQYEPICPFCENCPGSGTPTEITIASLSVTVDDIDGWDVSSISFDSWGSGKDDEYIKEVRLYVNGGLTGTGTYALDNGTIVLPIGKHLQPGETITLKLAYLFDFPDQHSSDHFGEFGVNTSVALLSADPDNYTRYEKLPPTNFSCGPQLVGPVENTNTGEYFATIQEGIDAENTKDGHTIMVCPGYYTENITLSKSLTINSREGREATYISTPDNTKNVISIVKSNSTISGFTISNASGEGVSGISITQSECNVFDNKLELNYAGLAISGETSLSPTKDCIIKNNVVSENEYGIVLTGHCSDNTIGLNLVDENNFILKNVKDGILLCGENVLRTTIAGNYIGINQNAEIGSNDNGIHIQNSAGNIIGRINAGNIISGNNENGIYIEKGNGNKVQYNTIGTNDTDTDNLGNKVNGIYLEETENSEILENLISGNDNDGIRIKKGQSNIIRGNKIGTTVNGTEKLGNEFNGIYLDETEKNEIHENLISGNINFTSNGSAGIRINRGKANTISNNKIGTTEDGLANLGNHCHGILIGDDGDDEDGVGNNKILDNLISGNGMDGINISGRSDTIRGNKIGLTADGNGRLGNEGHGICIEDDLYSQILNNIISGNKKEGISMSLGNEHVISGNKIGTTEDGSVKLGNEANGILLNNTNDNKIFENLISGNSKNGIELKEGRENEIRDNKIGTTNEGSGKLENGKNGIFISRSEDNNILENLISGNKNNGIEIERSKNDTIRNNKTGTNQDGSGKLANDENGICLIYTRNSEILENLISGNNSCGIVIKKGQANKIRDNKIGVTADGSQKLGNNSYGIFLCGEYIDLIYADYNKIRNNVVSGNSLTGIFVEAGKYNIIQGNKIGTSEDGTVKLGNEGDGIFLIKSDENTILENYISNNSKDGISIGEEYEYCNGNKIRSNKIISNSKQGVRLKKCTNTLVGSNRVTGNCGGVKEETGCSENTIANNTISKGWCIGTGIHISGESNSKITGNSITGDAGAAIHCENGANPLISKNELTENEGSGILSESGSVPIVIQNNIYDNNGYGLENADASVTIEANDNWWGDASGASGQSSGNVTAASWQNSLIDLVACTYTDTVYTMPGKRDSVYCSARKWDASYDELVDISIQATDPSWLVGETAYSLTLNDSLGADTLIYILPPESTVDGASNKLFFTATSQSNPELSSTDSVVVMTYHPCLASMSIAPDSVSIVPGDSLYFCVEGADQKGKSFSFDTEWTASSGTIDSTGYFKSGSQQDLVYITATDPGSQQSVTAVIQVATGPPVTSSIAIFPASVSLDPGETVLFTSLGYDQYGMKTKPIVSWEATGGDIDVSGFFQAGDEPGTFMVTARDTANNEVFGEAAIVVVNGGATGIIKQDSISALFKLYQNYPNPFKQKTTIGFYLKQQANVKLNLYDSQGHFIDRPVNNPYMAGFHEIIFNSRKMSPGLYFYQLEINGYSEVKKMLLMK